MTTEEFCNKQADLLSLLPEEFRGPVSGKAWEIGHAYGYDEVITHLGDMVDMLAEPISKFAAKLKKSTP